jgi:hypothetical protein
MERGQGWRRQDEVWDITALYNRFLQEIEAFEVELEHHNAICE